MGCHKPLNPRLSPKLILTAFLIFHCLSGKRIWKLLILAFCWSHHSCCFRAQSLLQACCIFAKCLSHSYSSPWIGESLMKMFWNESEQLLHHLLKIMKCAPHRVKRNWGFDPSHTWKLHSHTWIQTCMFPKNIFVSLHLWLLSQHHLESWYINIQEI